MSRYYKSTMAQPVDFVYNLPYQEMLQGIQAKTAVHEAGLNQLNKMSLAGQDIAYLNPDETEVKNYLSNFDATISELSQQDLTDPRARQALQKFTTQTARDFGASGKIGKIMSNYKTHKDYQTLLQKKYQEGKITPEEYYGALKTSINNFKGTIGENNTYNTYNPYMIQDHRDLRTEFRDELLKAEKDIIEQGGTTIGNMYFKDVESYREFLTPERRINMFNQFIQRDDVADYIRERAIIGSEEGLNAKTLNQPFTIEVPVIGKDGKKKLDKEGNPITQTSLNPKSYYANIYNYGNQFVGNTIKDKTKYRSNATGIYLDKKKLEQQIYSGAVIDEPFTLRTNDSQFDALLKNLNSIKNNTGLINLSTNGATSSDLNSEQMYDWLVQNTGIKRKDINLTKGPNGEWIASAKVSAEGVTPAMYPEDVKRIVSKALNKPISEVSIEEAKTIVEDYKQAVENSRMKKVETSKFKEAFVPDITKSFWGTSPGGASLNFTQDLIIYKEVDGEFMPIATSWDAKDVPEDLKNSYVGKDSPYTLTSYGVDLTGLGTGNIAGGINTIAVKGDQRYKITSVPASREVRAYMKPIQNAQIISNPLTTGNVIQHTDGHEYTVEKYLAYVNGKPVMKSSFVRDGVQTLTSEESDALEASIIEKSNWAKSYIEQVLVPNIQKNVDKSLAKKEF